MDLINNFKPDIVLLDIMMPEMNGFDFLKTVRDQGDTTIIIVNSNLSDKKDVQKALDSGANRYFKKADYTPSEIVVEVEKVYKEETSE